MDGTSQPALSPAARLLLARRLRGHAAGQPPVVLRRAVPRPADIPLSAAQRRLFFLDRLDDGSRAYLMPAAWRLTGPLEVAALDEALGDLVARHEQLRTFFVVRDGIPAQRIVPPGAFAVSHIDLAGLPGPERERCAGEAVLTEAARPFDLTAGPAFRAVLVRLADDEHILLLRMHHIVSDAWSTDILLRDLDVLYRARHLGARPDLPAIPIDYADYAIWQQGWLEGPDAAGDLKYWTERLAGMATLSLPVGRPRPSARLAAGAAERLTIDGELLRGLRQVAAAADATIFMTLLAAFQVVLAYHSGQDDVAVGTVVANRGRPQVEGLVGFFANTLVLRGDLSGHPSFAEFLGQVRENVLDAFDHQELPFERVVEALRPERELGRNPLFQVLFALAGPPGSVSLGGIPASPVRVGSSPAKFDLSVYATEDTSSLTLSFCYSTDLFDAVTIKRLATHLRRGLEQMVARPEAPIGLIEFLDDAERAELAVRPAAPSGPDSGLDSGRSVLQSVEERAASAPDAVAVVCGPERMTYRQLDQRARALARVLRDHGAGVESVVGVCMARGEWLVVALLAVWKAGACYLPMDPGQPPERLRFMIADAGAALVITDDTTVGAVRDLGVTQVPVRSQQSAPQPAPQPAPRPARPWEPAHPGNLAYVIYTSGSTGRPKGVGVTHHNLARLIAVTSDGFRFSERDVWIMAHSPAFDFSVWEIWGALATGGRVVVSSQVARDPAAMLGVLGSERVTVLNQTPAAFKGLRSAAGDGFRTLDVRVVISGGDAIDTADFLDWFTEPLDELPEFVNMYGITETTVHVTYKRIGPGDVGAVTSPIGRPVADLRGYVLDRHFRMVPAGVVGELYVGGEGLARGYLGRPGLTAERFLPDPFAVCGGRLYRTGDMVRRLPDGELEFLGRADDQVKIRGFRIELGEIEAALRSHPRISDAAVIAKAGTTREGITTEGPRGAKRLFAFVVTSPDPGGPDTDGTDGTDGRAQETAELHDYLRQRLPEYMVPALITRLASLPVTANGKIDRKALALLDGQAAAAQEEYLAPRTTAERVLAGVWAQVLGLARIGVLDNFFHLGGDSILALRVIGLGQRAGFSVTVPDIFRAQTLEELARVAGTAATEPGSDLVPPFAMVSEADRALLPADAEDAYPLTRLQGGMLHEWLISAGQDAYHNVTSLRLGEADGFDLEVFQGVVDAAVRRHEILRTSFDLARYSEPLQVVHRQVRLPAGSADLRGMDPRRQRELVRRYVADEATRWFDLGTAPLARLYVHRLSAEDFQLTITDLHAILDGWSLTSLLGDLLDGHRRTLAGEAPAAPAAMPRFAGYVALERDALASSQARGFWQRALAELTPLRFRRTGDGPGLHGAVRSVREMQPDIQRLARAAGVPRRTVFLAAFYRLLGLFAEDGPYSIGMVTNGRPERTGADQMRGLFLNTVPFGFPIEQTDCAGFLRATFAAEQELLPHRRFPLAEMQRCYGDGASLVEVVFNFVNFRSLTGRARRDSHEVAKTTFPLLLNASPRAVMVDARSEYFTAAGCEQLADMYCELLRAMTADPSGALPRPRLAPAARERLLREWAAGPATENPGRLLHEMFSELAATCPAAVAVQHEGGELTYGELDRRANRLAQQIRALGAGPESVVAICAGRGPAIALGVLGVLKAGAAYLPLDPDYPAGRLGYMLTDSAAAVLLTEHGLAEHRLTEHALPGRAHVIWLDQELSRPPDPAGPPDSGLSPDNAAYLIYTSGSTGRPKGTVVSHRGLVNFVHAQRDVLLPSTSDRVLQFASFGFDASLWELTWALANGARLCTPPKQSLRPGPDLEQTIAGYGVTAALLPPTALQVMDPARVGQLRTLAVGGEACPAEVAATWSARTRLLNCYGLTETSVWVTAEQRIGGTGRPPIGRPVRNTQAYVLDRELEPVPVGVPGELFIGGVSVARGYLNQPGMTADRFVPDLFAGLPGSPALPGSRLLRTGDIVRQLPGGALDYLGRADAQVKLGGYRIEPGEIESALRELPSVQTAAVLMRSGRLVAYIVPRPGHPAERDVMRRELGRRLPSYMLPSGFVFLAAMPLTSSEKIDRHALPDPAQERPDLGSGYVAPRTAAETALAGIWQDVLHVDRVGVHDDFFDLGGNSLSTVQVVIRSRTRGVEVTVRDLIENPTVAELASIVRGSGDEVRGASAARGDGSVRVRLREGTGRPLYCVHPTGGSVTWYRPLAAALRAPRPVIGLQARGLSGGVDPVHITEMAAGYVAEITAHDAAPHAVLGWSMGANIAFEMARLTGQIDPLILVEPAVPNEAVQRKLTSVVALLEDARELRDAVRGLPAGAAGRTERLHELRGVLQAAGLGGRELELDADVPIEVWHSLLKVMATFRLRPCSVPVHLVVSDEFTGSFIAVDGGIGYAEYLQTWRSVSVGGLTVHRVPGTHRTMLAEPLVRHIAEIVESRMPGERACES